MASINVTRAKALILTALIPALLAAGGCKSATTIAGPASEDSSIGTATADLPAVPVDSAPDAAPVSGTCPTKNTTAFAKTKFVLHSGAAFGAFHQWIWTPYRAGTFKKGSPGRVTAFLKGGASALFVKREIRLAVGDVKANPALCKVLAQPLARVGDQVQAAFAQLRGGDISGVTDVQKSISAIESQAKGAITEPSSTDPTSVPN